MARKTVMFDTAGLRIGNMWPQKPFQFHGPIVNISDYPGNPDFARQYGITGVATFADGASISLAGVIPADADLVATLQVNQ